MTQLTRKNVKFQWTGVEQKAFDDLKSSLINYPVLRHFRQDLPTELHTDASGYGLGAVLLQTDGSETYPIAYASKRLSDAEMKYDTTQRECLSIVWATGHFRNYLWGRKFKVVTDHHALC